MTSTTGNLVIIDHNNPGTFDAYRDGWYAGSGATREETAAHLFPPVQLRIHHYVLSA